MRLVHKAALGLALLAPAMTATPAAAQSAVECGGDYTVVRGDSLSAIAQRAYDDAGSFQIIYSANSESIGPNPALIRVGMRLSIPCLDAAVTPSTADEAAIRPVVTSERLPVPDDQTIRFVTATDWAPFSNEDQEQGGMATEIINVAMANAEGDPKYKIDFINDWGAHLRPLVSDHAYDFTMPWFRPNCDLIEKLGEGSKFRCNNLDWSEPIFEQLLGYYTRMSDPAPANYADLVGRTICRPAGYAIFMLEENDLVEPNVTLVRAASPAECFQGLSDGRFDAVALAVDTAEGAILELGTQDDVRYNEELSQVLTMHAVISKDNPNAEAYLAALDSGLRKIKDSQEWFEIVRRHLAAHRAKTASN